MLNDSQRAEMYRDAALLLEGGEGQQGVEAKAEKKKQQDTLEKQMARSGSSDGSTNFRVRYQRIFLTWSPSILGRECKDLVMLDRMICVLTVLCIAVSAGAFVMTQVQE